VVVGKKQLLMVALVLKEEAREAVGKRPA